AAAGGHRGQGPQDSVRPDRHAAQRQPGAPGRFAPAVQRQAGAERDDDPRAGAQDARYGRPGAFRRIAAAPEPGPDADPAAARRALVARADQLSVAASRVVAARPAEP